MVCRQSFAERPDVKVREIVVKQLLEGLCLGHTVEGLTCSCGAIHLEDGTVTEVVSPGDKYGVYQVGLWYLWKLRITPESGKRWSTGISDIISQEQAESIFAHYFYDLGIDKGD